MIQLNTGQNKLLNMENKIRCACCGYFTIENMFEICPVCYWQKDIFQEENINDDGGPNSVSLRKARENFEQFGAVEKSFLSNVRPPTSQE